MFIRYGEPNPNINPLVQKLIDEMEAIETVKRYVLNTKQRGRKFPWCAFSDVNNEKENILHRLSLNEITYDEALKRCRYLIDEYYK